MTLLQDIKTSISELGNESLTAKEFTYQIGRGGKNLPLVC
jgi:hypothetical protein